MCKIDTSYDIETSWRIAARPSFEHTVSLLGSNVSCEGFNSQVVGELTKCFFSCGAENALLPKLG